MTGFKWFLQFPRNKISLPKLQQPNFIHKAVIKNLEQATRLNPKLWNTL